MAEITKKAVLDIDASKSVSTVKDLRQALKEAKDNMVGLEAGSDAFLEAANKAGELKHQLDDINQATRAASTDFGDLMTNTAKVGAGMVGSFQAVKGAMTLLGAESENVEKAIQKMQASMAVVQGLQSIDQGVKSFKTLTTAIRAATASLSGFKAALLVTGLGAAVVILGELYVNWDKVTAKMQEWGIWAEDTKKKQDELNAAQQTHLDNLEKLQGKYDDVVRNNKIAKLNNEARKSYKELEDQIKEYQAQVDILDEKQREVGISKKRWQSLQDENLAIRDLIKQLKKQQDEILINENSYKDVTKVITTKNGATDEEIKKINELKKVYAEITAILYQQDFGKGVDRKLPSWERPEEDEDLDEWLDEQYSKIYEKQTAMRSIFADTANVLDEISGNPAWGKILDNISVIAVNWDDTMKNIKDGGKESAQAILQVFSASFAAVGALMSGLASEQDKSNQVGFESAKKYQIAAATMNMLSGITAAIASAMQLGPIAGPILGAINSAMVATVGGIQIAKIKQQQFEGNSQTNTSVPSISPAALSGTQSPMDYAQVVQGASIEGSIKDQRVYVTETDITDVQKKVDITETESVF